MYSVSVSVLHRNSERRRFCFWLHCTTHHGSPKTSLGVLTIHPSLSRTCRIRNAILYARCFTLAVEAFLLRFSGTQLAAWAGSPRARLSLLLGLASGWWLCHLTLQSALAQGQYSTSVLRQKLAKWLGMQSVSLDFWLGSAAAAAGNSSPWLEAGTLPENVEFTL